MSRSDPRLAHAYRVLADTALTLGAIALVFAVALPIAGSSNALPLWGTVMIAGLVAIAASIQLDRYRPSSEDT